MNRNHITLFRRGLKVTTAMMGRLIGRSSRRVSDYETGRRRPKNEVVKLYADILSIDLKGVEKMFAVAQRNYKKRNKKR